MLRAGVDQQTAETLMRNSDFSSSYTGLIDSIDQMLADGFSADGTVGSVASSGGGDEGPILIEAGRSYPAGQAILTRLNDIQQVIASLPLAVRKSVGSGKSVSVRVELGGRRIIKKKITNKTTISKQTS